MRGAIRPEKKGRIAAALKYILDTDGDALIDTSCAAVFVTDASEGRFNGLVCEDHLSCAALCLQTAGEEHCRLGGQGLRRRRAVNL
jgi:hypothetical protein